MMFPSDRFTKSREESSECDESEESSSSQKSSRITESMQTFGDKQKSEVDTQITNSFLVYYVSALVSNAALLSLYAV